MKMVVTSVAYQKGYVMSSKVKKRLLELQDIAEKLVDLGRYEFGRNWKQIPYEPLLIKVYTAESGNHKSCDIGSLNIAFFRPVQFEMSITTIDKLDEYLKHAQNALGQLQKTIDDRDESKAKELKERRKAALQEQLKELDDETKDI